MSIKAINKVLKIPASIISCAVKAVLIVLAYRADEGNTCWLHIDKLAEEVGVTKRTIIRSLNQLEAMKLIVKKKRKDGPHLKNENFYILNLELIAHFTQIKRCQIVTSKGDNLSPLESDNLSFKRCQIVTSKGDNLSLSYKDDKHNDRQLIQEIDNREDLISDPEENLVFCQVSSDVKLSLKLTAEEMRLGGWIIFYYNRLKPEEPVQNLSISDWEELRMRLREYVLFSEINFWQAIFEKYFDWHLKKTGCVEKERIPPISAFFKKENINKLIKVNLETAEGV